ncbi:unnamed protein product [Hydatigera taeniaeformis]|uniref:Uncharacterized protein n=1 Tax=Hydatigena taeniaeformis TaxID=6205 RepID=A0A0R3X1L7_HYDTA|nr:unnamed protein product [Hydatigera taeniaeformis]
MSLSNKRPRDTNSQCGAPYVKRVRNDAGQPTIDAFAELLTPARRFYAGLTGRPAIQDPSKETTPECSSPPLPLHIPPNQATLTDFGFHRQFDNRIRPPDSY